MKLVREVMSAPVIAVDPETTVEEVRRMAQAHGFRHVPVMARGDLIGVLCMCAIEEAPSHGQVSRWMTEPALVIQQEDSVQDAAQLMLEEHVGCLPVVADGSVVGIVTRGDLRNRGLTTDEVGGRTCVSCAAHHDVRPSSRLEGVFFCLECQERSSPPDPTDDIGSGD